MMSTNITTAPLKFRGAVVMQDQIDLWSSISNLLLLQRNRRLAHHITIGIQRYIVRAFYKRV